MHVIKYIDFSTQLGTFVIIRAWKLWGKKFDYVIRNLKDTDDIQLEEGNKPLLQEPILGM